MSGCRIARLSARTTVRVAGGDAKKFLQGLITSDIDKVMDGAGVHAALLTPQGKILFEFLVSGDEDGYLLDCPRDSAGELVKRLTFYKLRAAVEITDLSGESSVWAAWDGMPDCGNGIVSFPDPRLSALGHRIVAIKDFDAASCGCGLAEEAEWHAHRIALGVPESGLDYALGDTFPHEACYDQLGGIDFVKGCFVGQEVVSRMQHRGTARKRTLPVAGEGLKSGAEITAGESAIGAIGSVSGSRAIATLRLDRAEKAIDEGRPLEVSGKPVTLIKPDWAKFDVPGAAASS